MKGSFREPVGIRVIQKVCVMCSRRFVVDHECLFRLGGSICRLGSHFRRSTEFMILVQVDGCKEVRGELRLLSSWYTDRLDVIQVLYNRCFEGNSPKTCTSKVDARLRAMAASGEGRKQTCESTRPKLALEPPPRPTRHQATLTIGVSNNEPMTMRKAFDEPLRHV